MRPQDWLREQYPPDSPLWRDWTWGQVIAWNDPEVRARFRAAASAGRVVVEIDPEPMDARSAGALAGLLFGDRR